MASNIILKKSSVAAKVPVVGDLAFGELALNYTDGKLYYKKADGTTIDSFNAGADVTTAGTQTLTNKTLTSPNISNPVITSGTANGVTYLNGSKVLTTGSALTFNGSNLDVTGFNGYSRIGDGTFDTNRTDGMYIRTLVNSPIQFLVNNTEQMRLTNTGLGIGTSSPQTKLHIEAATTCAARITSTGNSNLDLVATATTVEVGSPNGVNLLFKTSNLERARIDTSGNLGIGTSSPNTKLHVYGDGSVYGQVQSSGAGNTGLLIKNTQRSWYLLNNTTGLLQFYDDTASATRLTLDSSGNLGLGVVPSAWGSGYASQQIGSGIALTSNSATSANILNNAYYNGSNWIYQSTNAASRYSFSSGTHAWYTAPSGTAGNAISFTQAMTLTAAGNFLVGTTTDEGERTRFESSSASQLALVYPGIGKFSFKVDSGRNLSILDGTTERMRLDASGNLGIGTSSPGTYGTQLVLSGSSVDVAGTSSFVNDSAAAGNANERKGFLAQGGATALGISAWVNSFVLEGQANGGVAIGSYSPSGSIKFYTNTARAERMRLDSSGNLGLGVVPSAWGAGYKALHIANGAIFAGHPTVPVAYVGANVYYDGTNNRYVTSNYSSRFIVDGYSGGFSWSVAPSGTAGNAISFTQAMTLDADGNLLLGTTASGGYRLEVSGTAAATDFNSTSDRTKKHNITTITDAVSKVQRLRGVEFDWIADDKHAIGVIAQEVEEVLPSVVQGTEGNKTVSYGNIVGVLIEAIKEQQQTIAALAQKVTELESRI
jgi:hypothetical protein